MLKKSAMDKPTRSASAHAILFDLSVDLGPPRIMKNSAVAKLAKIPKNAMLTRYVMNRIIG
jgi:hypothetical protein